MLAGTLQTRQFGPVQGNFIRLSHKAKYLLISCKILRNRIYVTSGKIAALEIIFKIDFELRLVEIFVIKSINKIK